MAASKSSKTKIVCGYSGKKGAYAQQAISKYFNGEAVELSLNSFQEIFKSVLSKKVDYGMIPIENTLAGSVYENYDLLSKYKKINIVGAVQLRIEHALLACKGATLKSIKTVYSHPVAFMQCEKFLSKHKDWKRANSISTATAASEISLSQSKSSAAIASAITATHYGLQVLSSSIEDNKANYTRMVVISSSPLKDLSNVNMASFTFLIQNKPGALYSCLGVFEKFNLNLTRLESRPVAGQPWHYRFYADGELSVKGEGAKNYIASLSKELKPFVQEVRLLGLYFEDRKNLN